MNPALHPHRRRRVLIATDLDRTMIYSRNAFGGAGAEIDAVCVEHLDGAPLSFMTVNAASGLRALSTATVLLPVTTRTIEQFRRIQLPGATRGYAVTSNGGNILCDGVPDSRWRDAVDETMRTHAASSTEVAASLRSRIDDSWVDKFRIADELFCYLVVRKEAVPPEFLAEWNAWCEPRGWSVSQQGRKIYTMPKVVCKSAAVAEVRRRLLDQGELDPTARLLAAGDGALDAEMLAAADYAIRPRHGELEQLAWARPHLTVTRSTGIRAGAEIVRWFAETATAVTDGTAGSRNRTSSCEGAVRRTELRSKD